MEETENVEVGKESVIVNGSSTVARRDRQRIQENVWDNG